MCVNGKFVISLDFELQWGVFDKYPLGGLYTDNIINVYKVLPSLLDYFDKYDVSATFAVVGMILFNDLDDLMKGLPNLKPSYTNKKYDNYRSIDTINSDLYPYYFAPDLVKMIIKREKHELATHTFSHYYCLEDGQNENQFRSDIVAAINVMKRYGIDLKTIVFPKNQFSYNYLNICKELNLEYCRTNETTWFYESLSNNEYNTFPRRIFRFIDSYLNLSGYNCYDYNNFELYPIKHIPSSRFLRPYSSTLKLFEELKIRRILNSMTYAAKNNLLYHLWWHPHNFGNNIAENFSNLDKILRHYSYLNCKYNFESYSIRYL